MSELLKLNVNDHVEKKGNLSYLSWAWAWAEVLKIDPQATWKAHEWNDLPAMFLPDGSAMVKVSTTIKGDTKTSPLPVMDHKNKAIKNPDSFAINTATMRALAKSISMHGLGLYIYAGEDLPEGEEPEAEPEPRHEEVNRTHVMQIRTAIQEHIAEQRDLGVLQEYGIACEKGEAFVRGVWAGLTTPERDYIRTLNNNRQTAKA